MLQEPPDNRSNRDVVRHPGDAGTEAADAPHDEVDRHAGSRGGVELLDDRRIDQVVDLHGDRPGGTQLGLTPDPLDDRFPQRGRGDEEPAVVALAAVAGEYVEQLRQVCPDLLIGREIAEVLVDAGGLRVVVAGADVAVTTQPVALAAHDQRELGVGLEAGDAVHHVDPGFFEDPRPGDVRLLVEAGLEFHQHHDLLAAPGGGDQRLHDRLLSAQRGVFRIRGAVQGLLDGDDVGITSGAGDERPDGVGERLVGQVDEDVPRGDPVEDALAGFASAQDRLRRGCPWLHRQVGAVDRRQRRQPGEGEHAVVDVHVTGADAHLLHEQFRHLVGHRSVDLEPHNRAEAVAGVEQLFHRLEKILRLLLDCLLGASRHPEGMAAHDLPAGEEGLQLSGDQVLDRDQHRARSAGEQPGEKRRDLDPGEVGISRGRVADGDGEVERQVRYVGEGVRGVDGQRGEHRVDLTFEDRLELLAMLEAQRVPAPERQAVVGEGRYQLVPEKPRHAALDGDTALPNDGELIGGAHPVRAGRLDPGGHLLAQAGDPHLEEFVEVPGHDRDESDPFQHGEVGVGRHRQDALEIVEHGQFAVRVSGRQTRLPGLAGHEMVSTVGRAGFSWVAGRPVATRDLARGRRSSRRGGHGGLRRRISPPGKPPRSRRRGRSR